MDKNDHYIEIAKTIGRKLESAPADIDENHKEYAAAIIVLRHFLSDAFLKRRVLFSETPDPFTLNSISTRLDWPAHAWRICELADHIYRLAGCDGFEVLLERLEERPDVRPTFFDARAAAYFQEFGFDVSIRKESGIKGQDFDFRAVRDDGTSINVEVTNCEAERFSEATLRNILGSKRKQLPEVGPSILYCVVPISWHTGPGELQAALNTQTALFFRGSSRINCVVYEWDTLLPLGDGALAAVISHPVINPNPRVPTPVLPFLFQDNAPGASLARKAVSQGNPSFLVNRENDYAFMGSFRRAKGS